MTFKSPAAGDLKVTHTFLSNTHIDTVLVTHTHTHTHSYNFSNTHTFLQKNKYTNKIQSAHGRTSLFRCILKIVPQIYTASHHSKTIKVEKNIINTFILYSPSSSYNLKYYIVLHNLFHLPTCKLMRVYHSKPFMIVSNCSNCNKLNNINYPFSLEAVESERLLFC